ncbi:MAG: hypothetical protein V3V19_11140 [Cocleimonas sp.]
MKKEQLIFELQQELRANKLEKILIEKPTSLKFLDTLNFWLAPFPRSYGTWIQNLYKLELKVAN